MKNFIDKVKTVDRDVLERIVIAFGFMYQSELEGNSEHLCEIGYWIKNGFGEGSPSIGKNDKKVKKDITELLFAAEAMQFPDDEEDGEDYDEEDDEEDSEEAED